MRREYWKWHSPALNRDMEILTFGDHGTPVLVFPTRMGRFYEYEDRHMIDVLSPQIEHGLLQFFCVDSIDNDSLYCDWRHPRDRIARHLDYERYILDEVLPFIAWRNSTRFLMVHGCSLGAFHAVNIAFRHPQRFSKIVAFSGRYDLCQPSFGFGDLFGGYYDETIYFNTPCHFVPNIGDPHLLAALRQLEIVLAIGSDDPFFDNNHHFSSIITGKAIGHTLSVWPGRAHDFHAWRAMATALL